jgi:DNA-binding XRE family transcriptional regulator
MKNIEKFNKLVSHIDENILSEAIYRVENYYWQKEAKMIAFKILTQLKEKGITQKQLAEKMLVSPQQINKWVSGNEKFSLDTLIKIQQILDIPIMASYYENNNEKALALVSSFEITENFDFHFQSNPVYQQTVNYNYNETFKIAS